jgi:hypothetical protein
MSEEKCLARGEEEKETMEGKNQNIQHKEKLSKQIRYLNAKKYVISEGEESNMAICYTVKTVKISVLAQKHHITRIIFKTVNTCLSHMLHRKQRQQHR